MDRTGLPVARRAGILLGLGLGGFIDGILLHQIIHWHNMGSAVVPPITMEAMADNMRWDGFFHAAVWLLTTTLRVTGADTSPAVSVTRSVTV